MTTAHSEKTRETINKNETLGRKSEVSYNVKYLLVLVSKNVLPLTSDRLPKTFLLGKR
jgi:hypothetical protein